MGRLGHWVCRESWAHKILFNLATAPVLKAGHPGPCLPFSFVCKVTCLCLCEFFLFVMGLWVFLFFL